MCKFKRLATDHPSISQNLSFLSAITHNHTPAHNKANIDNTSAIVMSKNMDLEDTANKIAAIQERTDKLQKVVLEGWKAKEHTQESLE